MLSKRARNTSARLAQAANGHKRILSMDAQGQFFRADGVLVEPSGALHELMETGVLTPSGDALLPGMTQTFQFNPSAE